MNPWVKRFHYSSFPNKMAPPDINSDGALGSRYRTLNLLCPNECVCNFQINHDSGIHGGCCRIIDIYPWKTGQLVQTIDFTTSGAFNFQLLTAIILEQQLLAFLAPELNHNQSPLLWRLNSLDGPAGLFGQTHHYLSISNLYMHNACQVYRSTLFFM